jgi:hypothetical protein
MFFHGQNENVSPTVVDYVFHSLFGLGFAFVATSMIVALFSDKAREKLHWGKGRGGPHPSRLGILLALPFVLFVPVRYAVAVIASVAGHEKTWAIPGWWFLPCAALFLLGSLYDAFLRR